MARTQPRHPPPPPYPYPPGPPIYQQNPYGTQANYQYGPSIYQDGGQTAPPMRQTENQHRQSLLQSLSNILSSAQKQP